jgi:hypothetical protein
VGDVTIAAELDGHSFLTPDGGPYESEDYIVIEAGVFGPAAKAISYADFSLRINGKKNVVASRPFEFVAKSLKDPQWVPPDAGPESKSKTGISSGGQGDASKPPPPKMPFDLRHAMEQRAEKAWFPEGTRALPQAGLLFFPYRGKIENIRSLELLYEGSAGKATINLQP